MPSTFQVSQGKLFAYQLPFKETLNFKGHQLSHRTGLILQLQNEQGHYSYGEIAPLPGFSQETLTQATQQIIHCLDTDIKQLHQHSDLYPSVQFGLDSALAATPIIATDSSEQSIPLLQGNAQQVIKHYLKLNKPPLIKLKVARESAQQEAQLVNQLTTLNPDLTIRLDANQAWQVAQAEQFFSQIDTRKIDYIEEPTPCHDDNVSLATQYAFSLALDESLQDQAFVYQPHPCIKALILKPTLMGSLAKIQSYLNIASNQQLQVSISSSFESVIALTQLRHLAITSNNTNITLGLDTLKYFQRGPLTDPSKILEDLQTLECVWSSD